MKDKKILTVQDISCVGQCSLTVALPIISACGIETCVLPSAVLSTHTAGFKGYTFRDLTEDIPGIVNHWRSEGINFDAIYTGYLGSVEQIGMVCDIMNTVVSEECIKIVDPAMADNGNLYPGFNAEFVEAMKQLCDGVDYLLPNITEASFLAGMEYKSEYDKDYILELIEGLLKLGCKNVILTGVSYEEGKTGVVVYVNGEYSYYEHDKIANGCHGTGDIYSSAFVGALMNGIDAYNAAKIAADYVADCIRETMKLDNHWYGAKFEPVLHKLYNRINENR